MKENSVENRIAEVASKPISGKLNLAQFKKEKAKALIHKGVCGQVLDFAKGNPYMPIYAILLTGVSSDAFKSAAFEKGYKKFNAEKAKATFEMSRAYTKKMGIKGQPNDVVWRLMSKFYDKVSTDYADFEKALNKAKVIEGADARGNYKVQCANLGIR